MVKTFNIASRDNGRLKHARKVRDGKEAGEIFVEGTRLCEEAVRSGLKVRECFVSTRFLKSGRAETLTSIFDRGVGINEINEDLFDSIADTNSPQGIALICDRPASDRTGLEARSDRIDGRFPTVVLLDEANNPANVGAMLRVVEASGAAGVIVSKNSADPFSAKAIRTSMGSAFRLPVWDRAEIKDALEWARERKMTLTAADVHGDRSYTQIDWKQPRLLIFGSEAHGMSAGIRSSIEDLVRIPMEPSVESLNLAVSAGVILFEARRQLGFSVA